MSRKQKRTVFYLSPVVVVIVLAITVKIELDRLEDNAQELAQMGQAAQKVLGDYREGLEKFDVPKILASVDDGFMSEKDGFWTEELQSERDGVRVFEWKLADTKQFNKGDVGEQVSRYLKTINTIEDSKFKIDSVEEIIDRQTFVIRSFLWVRGTRNTNSSSSTRTSINTNHANAAAPPATE